MSASTMVKQGHSYRVGLLIDHSPLNQDSDVGNRGRQRLEFVGDTRDPRLPRERLRYAAEPV